MINPWTAGPAYKSDPLQVWDFRYKDKTVLAL